MEENNLSLKNEIEKTIAKQKIKAVICVILFLLLAAAAIALLVVGNENAGKTKEWDEEVVLFEYVDFEPGLEIGTHVKFNAVGLMPLYSVNNTYTSFSSHGFSNSTTTNNYTSDVTYLAWDSEGTVIFLYSMTDVGNDVIDVQYEIETTGSCEVRGELSSLQVGMLNAEIDGDTAGGIALILAGMNLISSEEYSAILDDPDEFRTIIKKCLKRVGCISVNQDKSETEIVHHSEETETSIMGKRLVRFAAFVGILSLIPIALAFVLQVKNNDLQMELYSIEADEKDSLI